MKPNHDIANKLKIKKPYFISIEKKHSIICNYRVLFNIIFPGNFGCKQVLLGDIIKFI